MRSTNLAFDLDYIWSDNKREDRMFNSLTSDYMFKCDNYAVAYQLIQFLDKLSLCEHSDMTDDCFWPYSWIIFITCRPQDIKRIKYIANRMPSSIKANVRIFDEDEEEV